MTHFVFCTTFFGLFLAIVQETEYFCGKMINNDGENRQP